MLFAIGIILFIGLVIVHELGHMLVAKRNGVKVNEFGIFFPPRLFGKKFKKNGTLYSINAIPLGGFVSLHGEHDIDDRPHTYGNSSVKVKAKILLAGVGMNLVTAYALFLILTLVGMPVVNLKSLGFYNKDQFTIASDTKESGEKVVKDVVLVGEIIKDTPAERAGIKAGDQLVRLNDEAVTTPEKLSELTKKNAGSTVKVEVKTGADTKKLDVQLNDAVVGKEKGYLGVRPTETGLTFRRSTWSAPLVAAGLTAQFTEVTVRGVAHSIAAAVRGDGKEVKKAVGGPVIIVDQVKKSSEIDARYMLFLIAVISLSLAVMNALPLPPVDGGKLFVTLLFRILKKPLTKRAETIIYGAGTAVFAVFFIAVVLLDISRLRG
jgi:regulator of sigma E protease